ncbi:hypothetical protein [Candidatus Tisiphia endosymbiont of Beris chalybata]|uniref:hypothetical protein n=1 Tax=Candidatus Tisiphia endosymbiont of Beris chalybata TaxID=3066262 RepID=UPI00312CAA7B
MVDKDYKDLSVRQQSQLLNLNRSSLYYKDSEKDQDNYLSNRIVEIYSTLILDKGNMGG